MRHYSSSCDIFINQKKFYKSLKQTVFKIVLRFLKIHDYCHPMTIGRNDWHIWVKSTEVHLYSIPSRSVLKFLIESFEAFISVIFFICHKFYVLFQHCFIRKLYNFKIYQFQSMITVTLNVENYNH